MSTLTADDLLLLPDDEFRHLVDEDVRNQLDKARAGLLRNDPRVVDRWLYTLLTMKQSVEGQLAAKAAEANGERASSLATGNKRAWLDFTQKYERWRAGALRFKSGLEAALLEARRLKDAQDGGAGEAAILRKAIIAHRDHICSDICDDTCTADRILWSLVE